MGTVFVVCCYIIYKLLVMGDVVSVVSALLLALIVLIILVPAAKMACKD
jgi:hypothetical protein